MKMSKALPLVLAAIACAGAGAADLDFSMKLRGIAGTATKDGVRNGLGFGFNLGIPLAKDSKVNLEVGYRYLTGDGRNVLVPNAFGYVVAQDGTGNSANFQKTNVSGYTVRGTYAAPIADKFGWQAGVQLNFLKSRMDAVSDFRGGTSGVGSWANSPEKTGSTFSPLAGVTYNFNEAGGLELNLIMDSYKQVTSDPVFTGTNVTQALGSKNVNTLKLEFGYTFRF